MRETSFIRQNKEKWETFEAEFGKNADPEKTSNLFIQITDDLSYARTYYPNRSVKIYLNNLAQRVFQTIYKNRVRRRTKFRNFWSNELPQHMYEGRKTLFFTLALFMISFGIGVFSSMHDGEFARFILGDSYVEMTETNIAENDPMKVYKDSGEIDMFLSITLNNLWVSFLTLAFGIFFGVGTAYFILYNGIMIGAFQYFFIERGLFWDSFLTIWVHGALEISAIVIAGAAGLTLGRGLLFPGTLTRMQAFRQHGLRAIQMYMGITPIIVLAAINESFLTRYTDTPDIIRGTLIAVEFAFMYIYYVHIPKRKARAGFAIKKRHDEIPTDKTPEITLNKIKTNGQIFTDSFSVFRVFFWPSLKFITALSVLYCGIYFLFVESFETVFHSIEVFRSRAILEARTDIRHLLRYEEVLDFTTTEGDPLLKPGAVLFLINVISMSLITTFCMFLIRQISMKQMTISFKPLMLFLMRQSWKAILLFLILHSVLLLDIKINRLAFFAILPFGLILSAAAMLDTERFTKHIAIAFRFILQIILLFAPLMLLTLTFSCLSHSALSAINVQVLQWNIPFNDRVYEAIQDISISFMLILTLFMMVGMMAINMGLLLFSNKEVDTASDLVERIQKIGHKKSAKA